MNAETQRRREETQNGLFGSSKVFGLCLLGVLASRRSISSFVRERCSCSAAVAVEGDVQAGAEAEAGLLAYFGEPGGAGLERGGIGAFGHQ